MSYDNYSIDDFIMNESFKRWVKNPQSEEGEFWKEWISQHPDKKELTDEARQVILYMDFKTHYLSGKDVDSLWQKLDQRIVNREHLLTIKKHTVKTPVRQLFSNYRRLAAVFIGFLLISTALFFVLQYNKTTVYVTEFGETRTVLLPDGSMATLNANSILKYKSDWDEVESRKVWLKGEAFFSVVHTNNDQKFIVNTPDLDVEVLGTEFNVSNRKRGTEVVLNSGKVKLILPATQITGTTDKKVREIFMSPGDLVEYSKEEKKVIKEEVDAEKHTAWRNNKLIFEDTPISEIAQLLKDNYGLEVIMKDSTLANRTFTATYPADDIDVLLKAFSKSFNIKISRTENQLIFENNSQ